MVSDPVPIEPDVCEVQNSTIRFAHIDAAGIVFYPRYFEFIARLFPESPLASEPFAMHMQFRRPNKLGDRLTITFRGGAADWSFTGEYEGTERFSIQSMPADGGASLRTRPKNAFRMPRQRIGAWSVAADGRLQLSRYFEHVSNSVEEWFSTGLDVSFRNLHLEDRLGIPTVSFKTRCRRMPRLDEEVQMYIWPEHAGSKSLRLVSQLHSHEEVLLESEQIIVFVQLQQDGFTSIRMPEPIRTRVDAHAAALSG